MATVIRSEGYKDVPIELGGVLLMARVSVRFPIDKYDTGSFDVIYQGEQRGLIPCGVGPFEMLVVGRKCMVSVTRTSVSTIGSDSSVFRLEAIGCGQFPYSPKEWQEITACLRPTKQSTVDISVRLNTDEFKKQLADIITQAMEFVVAK